MVLQSCCCLLYLVFVEYFQAVSGLYRRVWVFALVDAFEAVFQRLQTSVGCLAQKSRLARFVARQTTGGKDCLCQRQALMKFSLAGRADYPDNIEKLTGSR